MSASDVIQVAARRVYWRAVKAERTKRWHLAQGGITREQAQASQEGVGLTLATSCGTFVDVSPSRKEIAIIGESMIAGGNTCKRCAGVDDWQRLAEQNRPSALEDATLQLAVVESSLSYDRVRFSHRLSDLSRKMRQQADEMDRLRDELNRAEQDQRAGARDYRRTARRACDQMMSTLTNFNHSSLFEAADNVVDGLADVAAARVKLEEVREVAAARVKLKEVREVAGLVPNG